MATSSSGGTNLGADFFFGWDLLYKTIESNVNKKSDVLIALTHFLLIKHNNFRCVGVGEDKTLSNDEVGSELLPDGWNDDENSYALRYAYNKELYLLLAHSTEDCLIINLLEVKTKKVSNIGLEPEALIKATKGRIDTLIPTASNLADRIRKELLEPVFTGTSREVTTQTNITPTPAERSRRSSDDFDPLRIGEPMRPRGQFHPGVLEPRPFGFPDVGRGDLDPLGRGPPGNLLVFPSRPDLRSGHEPRFDPFGPPDPNVRINPNPDHLQPPNWGGHDFYM